MQTTPYTAPDCLKERELLNVIARNSHPGFVAPDMFTERAKYFYQLKLRQIACQIDIYTEIRTLNYMAKLKPKDLKNKASLPSNWIFDIKLEYQFECVR